MGEGLTGLEVLSIGGECMLALNVADSLLGREVWKMILDQIPSKPGLQLVVSHTSRLVLHESLQQQGLGGQRAQVSATYMPVNLHAAWRFAHGGNVEDEEFSLNGITEVTGVDEATSALLHNLPKSLCTLTLAHHFNQGLHHVRLPAGLQTVTFGALFNQSLDNLTWSASLQRLTFPRDFNQSLDNVTWPAGLQSLTFRGDFNQCLDNVTWPTGHAGVRKAEGEIRTYESPPQPSGLWWRIQSEPGQPDVASRPSKCDFWSTLQSGPGQRDMASRPAKFDFSWRF